MTASTLALMGNTERLSVRSWQPLCRRKLHAYYEQMQLVERIELFFSAHPDLSEDEKAILLFLDFIGSRSASTLQVYMRYLSEFLNFCQKSFLEITILDCNAFAGALGKKGRARSSISTILGAVKSFYKCMMAIGLIKVNPSNLIKVPKEAESERVGNILQRALSFEEVDQLIGYLRGKGTLRDLALFYLMARMGLRAEEVCRLTWKNMSVAQSQWVMQIHGKGNKRRTVAIPEEGVDYLLSYRQIEFCTPAESSCHPQAIMLLPLFSVYANKTKRMDRHNINRIMKNLAKKAGVRHFSPHDLRHTCFTHLSSHFKVSLSEIQKVAGHESISTTMRYIEAGSIVSGATLFFDTERFLPNDDGID